MQILEHRQELGNVSVMRPCPSSSLRTVAIQVLTLGCLSADSAGPWGHTEPARAPPELLRKCPHPGRACGPFNSAHGLWREQKTEDQHLAADLFLLLLKSQHRPGGGLRCSEPRSLHHRVAGSVCGQGANLGCRFNPQSGV